MVNKMTVRANQLQEGDCFKLGGDLAEIIKVNANDLGGFVITYVSSANPYSLCTLILNATFELNILRYPK